MALVSAKCTHCGEVIQVDSAKEAAICEHCGTPFITEKAIDNYNAANSIKKPYLLDEESDDFVISSGKLTAYNGSDPDVIIPGNVKTIEDKVFRNRKDIISVVVPYGVTGIRAGTFSGCTGLKKIKLPSTVGSIGFEAFKNCTSLTGVVIPDGVRSIGGGAFGGCVNLVDIAVPASVTSIGHFAFDGTPFSHNNKRVNGLCVNCGGVISG